MVVLIGHTKEGFVELLLVAGLVALIVLVLLGLYMFIQGRRSGTVRAAVSHPTESGGEGDREAGS